MGKIVAKSKVQEFIQNPEAILERNEINLKQNII